MKNPADSSLTPHAEPRPASWGSAVLAGLPHAVMGTLIGIGKLGIIDLYQGSETHSAIIGMGLSSLVIGVLVFAWRQSWPLWSASWYLYGTWVVMAVLGLGVERLSIEESWRYTNVLFIGWILVYLIKYFVILTKSGLHGLLSVAFLFPFLGVLLLEFVPNPIEGWLVIGLGALGGLTAFEIVRARNNQTTFRLIFSVNLIAGVALAYVGEYQITDLPTGLPVHTPEPGRFLELLAVYTMLGLGLIGVPALLRGLLGLSWRKLTS